MGLQVFYRLDDPLVEKLCALVCDTIVQDAARTDTAEPADHRQARYCNGSLTDRVIFRRVCDRRLLWPWSPIRDSYQNGWKSSSASAPNRSTRLPRFRLTSSERGGSKRSSNSMPKPEMPGPQRRAQGEVFPPRGRGDARTSSGESRRFPLARGPMRSSSPNRVPPSFSVVKSGLGPRDASPDPVTLVPYRIKTRSLRALDR